MDAHHHGSAPSLAASKLAYHDVLDLAPLRTAAEHAVVTPTSEKASDAANVGVSVQTKTQHFVLKQLDDGKWFARLWVHLRSCVEHLIVFAACWGLPAAWAQWLIARGGLVHV
jgi:hypothetical protein